MKILDDGTINSMKISIAMTTCNGDKFLNEQLESILNQTVPPSEIIICDDASTDDTIKVIELFQKQHTAVPIHLFRNPVRLGSSGNFEQAIRHTSGEIIFLADQDDYWLPEKIEKMINLLLHSPHAGGVFSNSKLVDANLNDLGRSHWQNRGFPDDLRHFQSASRLEKLALFLTRVPAAGHAVAFRSSLKAILLPFPGLPECHDTWIGMILAALDQWECTGEQLTLFRQHGANASNSGQKFSLAAQWREARRSIAKNTFAWNAELYRCLLTRLDGRCPADVMDLLSDRMEHSQARANMNRSLLKRFPFILAETRNARYFRYGRGFKSILQDLFLR